MRTPKFAVGDLVRISDAMSDGALASSGYRRADRLTVLSVYPRHLHDGGVFVEYVISGGRMVFEHALEKADSKVHTEARLVVDASAVEKALGEITAKLDALVAALPKPLGPITRGLYRARCGETITVVGVDDDDTYPVNGLMPAGNHSAWTASGRFTGPSVEHKLDLVERIGDLP